ncbi:uncharacterized protein BP5553_06673 [Venustampulla echinocandica]|uniref:Actin-like ATPase domain-containing protein n=1 Tax=Venustampulla echinocandica TaxID=2656787 RepID=A0A370TKL0_9HELO|nr:uncharacterized protein BP5553_06673 [Venustampulla echinocandica]RDL36061.1 hypothetical protein BP5553_06673 [Venustampulla echinocandica]
MDVVINIDFGMTGSAAEWWFPNSTKENNVELQAIGKIPTEVAYSPEGDFLAWGNACKEIGNELVQSGFKGLFDRHIPEASDSSEQTDDKLSMEEVKRSKNSYLVVNVTEALASCEYITRYLEFEPGTMAISCGMGGATIDTAFAIFERKHEPLSRRVFPIAGASNIQCGVSAVDKKLSALLRKHPLSTNAQFPISTDLRKNADWQHARNSFDGSNDVTLTLACDFRDAISSSGGKIAIDGLAIRVPRAQVEKLFDPLLTALWNDIDYSLEQLKRGSHGKMCPTTVVLCGGGGTTPYIANQLKLRYQDFVVKVLPSPEASALATVRGHGIYLKRMALETYLGSIGLGLSMGSLSGDHVVWQKSSAEGVTMFDCTSRKEKAVHYFIVHKTENSELKPCTVEYVKNNMPLCPEMLVWTLHVAADKYWPKRQRYYIEITCMEKEKFSFRAYERKNPEVKLELEIQVFRARV